MSEIESSTSLWLDRITEAFCSSDCLASNYSCLRQTAGVSFAARRPWDVSLDGEKCDGGAFRNYDHVSGCCRKIDLLDVLPGLHTISDTVVASELRDMKPSSTAEGTKQALLVLARTALRIDNAR